jgi:SET domain-containing protein
VRRSTIHSRGLFALAALPAKRKLGELLGEIVPEAEARRHDGQHCIKLVEFGDGWALDASRDSNDFQFVNHSCTPNAYIRCFRHRVEFYSLRAIAAGEELTCDYGETQHEGALSCRCGSARCRRRL